MAQKAYIGVFGYQTFPEFTSDRLNYQAIVFHPLYGFGLDFVPAEVTSTKGGPGRVGCPGPTP